MHKKAGIVGRVGLFFDTYPFEMCGIVQISHRCKKNLQTLAIEVS
jgi:hypothetical protein